MAESANNAAGRRDFIPLADPGLHVREEAFARPDGVATVQAARATAHAAALGWWQAAVEEHGADHLTAPAVPPGLVVPALSPIDAAAAAAFGRTLARVPTADANAAIGRLYTDALPEPQRRAHGVFYTPPSLVRRLLDKAEAAGHDWRSGRALDPSCGGGAFLVEAASRMAKTLAGADPAIVLAAITSRLRGWELDPFAAWLANLSVEMRMLPLVLASGRRLGVVAEVRDALAVSSDAAGPYDLVMGNPPFGKIKDTLAIRGRFARSLHGHPNLYGLFTDLAVQLARPDGGIVVYLTPASFLAGHYFKALRRLLHHEAPPVTLDIVESRKDVFADVLQEVALSCFRRGGRGGREAKCAVVVARREGLAVQPTGNLVLPEDPEAPWTLPRSAEDAAFVERLQRMPARLADWGYGVSTGPLVWNRHKPRLYDEPGPGRVPVVWAEAVTQDGCFVLKASKKNHKPWYQPRSGRDPNLVAQPCVLVQRTTAKEQHRRLICAEMPADLIARFGRVTVENHLNMVRPIVARPKLPVSAVAAFLATATADRVLRCINASVAVSASELEAMPLPQARDVAAALAEADTEAAVRRLYGLDG